MIRQLYSLVLWLAQPLLRRKLRRRAVAETIYGEAVEERFGHYASAPDARAPNAPNGPNVATAPSTATGWIWIHAVSLGETKAAGILLRELRQQIPDLRLLLTNATATGRAEGAKLLRPGDVQVWQPWDTPSVVQRFLDQFQPRIGILMETEVWPNLTAACAQRGIPLTLANARMSAQSLAKAQRLSALAHPAYAALRAVWAQTQDDATRLQALGAKVSGVFGNLKFDDTPNPTQCARGKAWRAAFNRPVLLLASSRVGEESSLIDPYLNLRSAPASQPPQLLIVPRHPQRVTEVMGLLESWGLTVSRRSSWGPDGPPAADVWVGDSMGEMALYYSLADLALLGGSFAPLGGQNLIEAAACACPVVMGPHTFNFAEAAQLAENCGAALRADGMEQALEQAQTVLQDGPRHAAMALAASQFAAAHRGACHATATAIKALLSD